MNIILCGLPKSGKSTIGALVAKKLRCPFVDTDRLIEEAYFHKTGEKLPCRMIYLKERDDSFRKLETEQVKSLENISGQHLIAVGGGTLNACANIAILRKVGHVIYLKAPPQLIWGRLRCRELPAYLDLPDPETQFFAIAKERSFVYENASHTSIDITQLNRSKIINKIIEIAKGD